MVTNVEETETVTLSALQAQVGVELTATYNDVDNEKPGATDLTWKWYLGGSQISVEEVTSAADLTSMYTPGRAGSLRAEASYTKTDGSAKTVSKTVSVRAAPSGNNVDSLASVRGPTQEAWMRTHLRVRGWATRSRRLTLATY